MNRKNLLFPVCLLFTTALLAQEKQATTGYAITPAEKGGRGWKEVRRIDLATGEVLATIYQSNQPIEMLNARTGKAIVPKEPVAAVTERPRVIVNGTALAATPVTGKDPAGNVYTVDNGKITIQQATGGTTVIYRQYSTFRQAVQTDKPMATSSAACAYDKKHERLYYTPMGINQLRYFDLKSKTPKVYYFEDEAFGAVKGSHDADNQITRMVIASDGNGYALTNDGNHLIKFTTGKKPEITDLGAVTDDEANGKYSIHNRYFQGGDMIADADKNLYLISANRHIFKINIETKTAAYKGSIKGLPAGYTTNGAMVQEDSKVILASSESTEAYYRFDLNTLQAEKISDANNVYNASDLANGNLAFARKKKDKQPEPPIVNEEKKEVIVDELAAKKPVDIAPAYKISAYPNPVTNGSFQLSFNGLPAARYVVQVVDLEGKLVQTQDVVIGSKAQVEQFTLPANTSRGTYLVKITNAANKISVIEKITVQ
jgi:hypothetical protein